MRWINRRVMISRLIWMYHGLFLDILCFGRDMVLGAWQSFSLGVNLLKSRNRQRSLFHVLHCFSLRCETCGYVQGMGPIAATLLCYFEPEHVYASLVRLHDAYSMHSIFSPGFPGLLEAIYIQERITEQMMPDVYAAFKKHITFRNPVLRAVSFCSITPYL